MSTTVSVGAPEAGAASVHPFTGFGNFLGKEFRDWWSSRRFLIVFTVATLVQMLSVFFVYGERIAQENQFSIRTHLPPPPTWLIGTRLLLEQYRNPMLFIDICIIIFSTMGLLAGEKAAGTLAWNLTKPLGRSGVFVAKWLAATASLWVAMCFLPLLFGSVSLMADREVTPDFRRMIPVVGASCVWIGFWVLLVLTISLGFRSPTAVGAVALAVWVVPNYFSFLLSQLIGIEEWEEISAFFGPNAPWWSFALTADKAVLGFGGAETKDMTRTHEIWSFAFIGWSIVLSIVALSIFQRQEVEA